MTDHSQSLTTPDDLSHAATDTQSAPFIGRWQGLVSTTNWEKGRVIAEWRAALISSDADVSAYSDEAWSRRVGNITPQHVGRLRRVFETFGDTYATFEGLYWSHFHAAIDWDDAEMWLEGAVQNKWSVSQMRKQRWETISGEEGDKPDDQDIVTSEQNEDIDLDETSPIPTALDANVEKVEGLAKEERTESANPSTGDSEDSDDDAASDDSFDENVSGTEAPALVRPFADLPELPDDLADAFDEMKLAILRHKVNQWKDISLDDVLVSLDALKQLASAPSGESSGPR